MLTVIDPQMYSPNEYNIVAMPSKALVEVAVSIQRQLVEVLGDAIWLTPPDALHITIIEITGPHTQPVPARRERYMQWQQAYGEKAKDIIHTFSPVSLQFTEIAISQRAIILKAANPEPLNVIRSALLTEMRLPEGTNLPPDIAHITLARYSKAIELDDAVQKAEKLSIDCSEYITSFSLLKDITPPDFNITHMDTYSLGG